MTRLHVNCKFLLNSWSICYITMFTLHIVMFALNFSMDGLPKNKADPPIRISLYTIIIGMQLITTIYELCIATERLISSIRPKQYYARALDRKYLYPATFAIAGCLMICQYYMTEGGNHTLFSVIVLSLDLFTISVNEFAIKYGTRRFERMQGKTTLNGRYQVKESSQLAKAMQPVYICSFTLKLILFAPVLVFCYETNEEYDCVSRWFYIPFAYMELAYFGTLTAASVFVIAYFIRIHPRLRRRAEKLYQMIRGIPVTDEPSEPFVMQERASEGDIYFEKLARVWDEGLKGVNSGVNASTTGVTGHPPGVPSHPSTPHTAATGQFDSATVTGHPHTATATGHPQTAATRNLHTAAGSEHAHKATGAPGIPVTHEPSEPFVVQVRADEGDEKLKKLKRVWDEGLRRVT
ncbi:hypothetical protein PRIPAC_79345 [Pristionchus pacificus]|uniref:Uncharacterized protein n=1 Tax=Pristionchus pacificus TaxID=54126 RepID=A0A2A6CM06_PRIPA|nr:hypothetical protein PRIPAC_79345 [Pristionchus pacificus]|eukprot:PDM79139.1 hypothetical protein PRIPAC_31718 [Pristionchus pacificus]